MGRNLCSQPLVRTPKEFLTAVKNSFGYSQKLSELYFFMCESLLLRLWHIANLLQVSPNYGRKTRLFMKRILRFESEET